MIVLSKMIDYIKLASRTMGTVLTDAELMMLTEIALNQLWLDLEIGISSSDTNVSSEDTTISVQSDLISPLKIEVIYKTTLEYEKPNFRYILLDDLNDKDFYIKTLTSTTLQFHAKQYKDIDFVRLVQLNTLDIPSLDLATTQLPNQYITPILNYMSYLSYTLLGWKDYDTAQWHRGEYDRAIETLKRHSHEIQDNLTIYREEPIQRKGFV